MTWLEKRTQKTNNYAQAYMAAAEPHSALHVDTLAYNDEENNILGNLQTDIMTCVTEPAPSSPPAGRTQGNHLLHALSALAFDGGMGYTDRVKKRVHPLF